MEILDPQPQSQPENQQPQKRFTSGIIIVGVLFIAVGLVLFADNANLISNSVRHLLLSWPMLLLVLGCISLVRKHTTPGIVLCVIGGVFLMPRIGYYLDFPEWFNVFNWHNLWPLAFIAIGIFIVVQSKNKKNLASKGGFTSDAQITSDGHINMEFIFNGSEQVFLEPVFRGGNIETVFGGMTLDLRRTSLPEGITYLKVEAVFGGITLLVPEEWDVEVSSHCVFGGFTNKRMTNSSSPLSTSKLIIQADCAFGGGEVR